MIKFLIKKIKSKKESISKKKLKKFLPNNPVIVEAGADSGSDSIEMAKLWPAANIYAFEPVPESFKKLQQNTANYSSIHCYNLALSNKTEKGNMYISNTYSSSSLLEPKEHLIQHPEIIFNKVCKVNTITLSDWLKQENINQIDFLWLDLQGAELVVLKESERVLEKVKVIYTEVSLMENYKNAPLYSELKNYLVSQGFIVKKEFLPWQDMGNVLFVKK